MPFIAREVKPQLEKNVETTLEKPKQEESDINLVVYHWKMDGEIDLGTCRQQHI